MFRIDGPGATNDNKFTEGDPANGTRATVVSDEWLNAVQEEIAQAIEAEGLALDKQNSSQLSQLISSKTSHAPSVSAIEGLLALPGRQIILSGSRGGDFEFDDSDLSSEVSGDPRQGVYIAPNSDPTGASGAWVRQNIRFIDPAWYGADITGTELTDDEWGAAFDHALGMGLAVLPSPGTYKKGASTTKDNFTGLYVFGRGQVTIDFQANDAFAFGDFTADGSGFATQTEITCRDIVFHGVKFAPSDNGWDGSNFAYARPLAFSSAQNIHVEWSQFFDNHVGAIDFFAPCKDVFIEHNHFESSEEAGATYGPRPFCYVSPLDNLDETTGTLAYPAPDSYHENVNIKKNTFQQIGRGIVSWNVHGFDYSENIFRKPLIRTISATNWSFDGVISRNTHIAQDNSVQTLSTFVNIGVGSERVKVMHEKFLGLLSGTGINSSLKCIDCGGVSKDIEVLNNTFNTAGMAVGVNVGPNVGITISQKNLFLQNVIGASNAPIVLNESGASSPGFDFPKTIISDNVDYANNRFVSLVGAPPGTPEALEVHGNRFKQLMVNRLVVADTDVSGWAVSLWDNDFPLGSFNYVQNFGTGGLSVRRFDRLERAMSTINTSGASVTLDWKDHGGEEWYVVPDQSQTISDITGAIGQGQRLTIVAGGTLTINQGGSFRLDGAVNVTLGENDSISFIRRSSGWLETGRSNV